MFSRISCHPPTGCYPTPPESRPYTRMFIITYCLFQCLFLSQPIYTKWYILITFQIQFCMHFSSRSQWPSGLKPGYTADRLLELWVRITPRAWMSVACDCFVCVLSGTGFSEGPIPRPEESHRPTVVRHRLWSRNVKNEASLIRLGPEKKCISVLPHTCYMSHPSQSFHLLNKSAEWNFTMPRLGVDHQPHLVPRLRKE